MIKKNLIAITLIGLFILSISAQTKGKYANLFDEAKIKSNIKYHLRR